MGLMDFKIESKKYNNKIKKIKMNTYYRGMGEDNGTITVNESYEGERIEEKVERFVNGGEPITDGAPLIYTEREDGVRPEYNIRTDRWEIGLEAMDYVTRSERAKRDNVPEVTYEEIGGKEEIGSTETTQATNE